MPSKARAAALRNKDASLRWPLNDDDDYEYGGMQNHCRSQLGSAAGGSGSANSSGRQFPCRGATQPASCTFCAMTDKHKNTPAKDAAATKSDELSAGASKPKRCVPRDLNQTQTHYALLILCSCAGAAGAASGWR